MTAKYLVQLNDIDYNMLLKRRTIFHLTFNKYRIKFNSILIDESERKEIQRSGPF
jgi:hypothetical protein